MGNEHSTNGNGAAMQAPRTFITERPIESPALEEVKTCRSIANRCAFILGPARSGTTILAQIINANDRAFLTTEANFYQAGPHPDFREWYNGQHLLFQNQISKISYAPHFNYPGEHEWWKWLARTAEYYDVVGDKMAFTDHHVIKNSSVEFMPFFEARFFESRYIWIFRDPVQTILSSTVLWDTDPLVLIRSWASMVKLWADFIRVFPFTITILHADLNDSKTVELGTFLGLDLSGSGRLLDSREQRQHQPGDIARGTIASKFAPILQMIYGEIKESIGLERVLLQADQKRGRLDCGTVPPASAKPDIAVVSTSVGRAWNLADRLLKELREPSEAEAARTPQ
jgi:Sulfotransferase family